MDESIKNLKASLFYFIYISFLINNIKKLIIILNLIIIIKILLFIYGLKFLKWIN
jgi:hypothetical protein